MTKKIITNINTNIYKGEINGTFIKKGPICRRSSSEENQQDE
jgi:hypothetical protein